MNNKVLGTSFENEVCEYFAKRGFWVHFLAPDSRGAQPFDVIAVKNGRAFAIECKTLTERKRYFDVSRLEDNQVLAFRKWMNAGNGSPIIAIKYKGLMTFVRYDKLIKKYNGSLDMREVEEWHLIN